MKSRSKFDIEFLKPKSLTGMTPVQALDEIANRLNTALSIQQENDAAKGKTMFAMLRTRTFRIMKLVPFRRRPQSLTDLLFLEQLKRGTANMLIAILPKRKDKK